MRALTPLAAEMLATLRAREAEGNKDPLPVAVYIRFARQLERRGLVEIGNTDQREANGTRRYWVTLTAAGRSA